MLWFAVVCFRFALQSIIKLVYCHRWIDSGNLFVLNATEGEEVRMDVVMRIFNTDIHYGLVAEIRRKLKHQVAKRHSQTINIQWTDMLYTGE